VTQDERRADSPPARRSRILVAGLGNDLMTDDGVGVHLARAARGRLPRNVRVVEVGTAVLDAYHLFEKADLVLALDAMQAGGKAGSVYRFRPLDVAERTATASMHDFSFVEVLRLLRKTPRDVVVIGVEPAVLDYGLELSPAVQAGLPLALVEIERTISAWQTAC
jgi:hydrogenase maturation protease